MKFSFALFGFGLASLLIAGCSPSIGDSCKQSRDCIVSNRTHETRICDTSQPGGYCTIMHCAGDGCPDGAVCILFNPSLPGCPYNDRSFPRTGRSFCMESCESDSDCDRQEYMCADPRQAPWYAWSFEKNQSQRVCLPRIEVPSSQEDAGTAPVCESAHPDPIEPIDASTHVVVSEDGST